VAHVETAVAAPPCAMVIFGAAGELTKRLIGPALYNLVNAKRLSNGFRLVAVDHNARTVEQWRDGLTETMKEFACRDDGEFQVDHINQAAWQWLTERMTYLQGDFTDPRAYSRLLDHLAKRDSTPGTAGNYLFYLAVSDRFGLVVDGLAMAGLVAEGDDRWRRVVIEKPFGHDLPLGKALNAKILKVLKEDQIYRIDHFSQETVQNTAALRFANGMFEPL
jgi:glucose-6-phosphate 1-dehydrogenase